MGADDLGTREPSERAAEAGGGATVSRAEYEAIHGRMRMWLRRWFVERIGERGQVPDDLCQKTWMAVWRAVSTGQYDPSRSALTTFVYAVAQNMYRQHAKTASRSKVRGADGLEEFEDDEMPTGAGEATGLAEMIERVRRALAGGAGAAGLTADEVQVLSLLSRGESDRGLAERLGVAPSTANARKRAALEKLRRYLGGGEGK